MSSINNDTNINASKLSDYEITKYQQNYGVTIKQKNKKTQFSGTNSNIEKVKAMIKQQIFLSNNPVPTAKSKPGSLSSQLNSVEYKPKYTEIFGGSRSKPSLFQTREFTSR